MSRGTAAWLASLLFLPFVSTCSDGGGPAAPGVPATVRVSPEQHELAVGETVQMSASALDASGAPMSGYVFTWSSETPSLATVDEDGLVTALDDGDVRIFAHTSGRYGTAAVTVLPPPQPTPDPAIESTSPDAIQAGWQSFNLVVTGTGFTPDSRVLWNQVALGTTYVSSTELSTTVTASRVAKEGTAQIMVETVSGPDRKLSNAVAFTIHPTPAYSVDLFVAGNAIFVGHTLEVHALARDQFGVGIPDREIVWTSSDTTIARVVGQTVVGVAPGSITLVATAEPAFRGMTFHVVEAPGAGVAFTAAPQGLSGLYAAGLSPTSGYGPIPPYGRTAMHPAPSPDGTRIAFTAFSDGSNLDIYVENRDGTGLERLTTDGAIDDQPAWSPDGEWITFRSFRDGKSDVWIMRSDGTDQTNLTFAGVFLPEEHNDQPTWSHDGERIVFSRGFGTGQGLYTIRTDGSDLVLIRSEPGYDLLEPAWSPDGTMVAYRRYDRQAQANTVGFLRSSDGEPLSYLYPAIPPDARSPAWIDGEWLAVTARVNPAAPGLTLTLVRLGWDRIVAPVSPHLGYIADPARLPR